MHIQSEINQYFNTAWLHHKLSYILRNSPEKIGNFSVEAVLSTFLSQHENQKKSFLKPVGISSKNVNRAFSLTWSKCLDK